MLPVPDRISFGRLSYRISEWQELIATPTTASLRSRFKGKKLVSALERVQAGCGVEFDELQLQVGSLVVIDGRDVGHMVCPSSV
jgi:hypothetical protein